MMIQIGDYYKSIFDLSPQAMILHGKDGSIIEANAAARRILGPRIMAPDRILVDGDGHPLNEADHPVNQALRTGKSLSGFVMGIQYPGQQHFDWISVDAVPVFGEDGALSHIFSIIKDINGLRAEAEESRKREAYYRLIAEHASDFIWVFNVDQKRFTYASPAILQLSGYTAEEFLSQGLENTLTEESLKLADSKLMKELPRFLASDQDSEFWINQFQQKRKDGGTVWIETSTRFRKNARNEVEVLGVSRNIEQRRRVEEELRQAYDEKSVLLSELQHRVKNSFALITSMVQLASGSSNSDETRKTLEDVLLRISAISELYAILYSNGSFTEVAAAAYCKRLVGSLLELSSSFQVATDFDDVAISIKTATALGIILTELVTNAIKYAYGPGEAGAIRIALKKTGSKLLLIVADEGRGLGEGFDLDRSSGLGLTLVQALSAQLDGKLSISSDKGTRCELLFPAEEA